MTSDSNQVKLTFIGSYNLLNSREFLSAYVHSAFWHIRPISPEARLDKHFQDARLTRTEYWALR